MRPIELTWPLARLDEAVVTLAQLGGLTTGTHATYTPPANITDSEQIGQWLRRATVALGIDVEPSKVRYPDVSGFLRKAGPALIRLPGSSEPRFLALLQCRRNKLSLIGPDLRVHQAHVEIVRSLLCHDVESPLLAEIEELLDAADVSLRRRAKARTVIFRQRLRDVPIEGCWLLQIASGSNFWQQLRRGRVLRWLALLVSVHSIQYSLYLVSWWLVGRAVFEGRVEVSWLLAWALLLLTLIPLNLLVTWLHGMIAIAGGCLIQKRLLYGALRLHPDEVRHQGVGHHMGRVFESEAVESLAINGGLLGLTALVELSLSAWVLSQGAARELHVLLLLGWIFMLSWFGYRHYRQFQQWSTCRREMTHDLIETMVGYRTRLAQVVPERWHDGEDEALASYVDISARMDAVGAGLVTVASRGWLIIGVLGLLPVFVAGSAAPASLAIGIGGVLSATLALRKLAVGAVDLTGAAVAWEQIEPLFRAAVGSQEAGSPGATSTLDQSDSHPPQPVLAAHNLSYRYSRSPKPILQECSLEIQSGDRILLEGESGGGKSTLAAILTGLRQPDSGLLLVNGLDRQTLGEDGWRQCVAAAPQFHENHILGDTFLFNVLMGRGWPPRAEDIARARQICEELGLGALIQRMPGGMLQMVGEIGWQLSHGEKSRLYIARALLQEAELVILDESFAALDPETLQRAMECARKRARSLIVITHP